MWASLGALLAQVAVAVLREYLARDDIKRGERQRLLIEQLGLERAALEWTAEALRDPARAATLRLRGGAGRVEGFQPTPGPGSGSSEGDMRRGG